MMKQFVPEGVVFEESGVPAGESAGGEAAAIIFTRYKLALSRDVNDF